MAIYRVPVRLDYGHPGSPGVNIWHVRVGAFVTDPPNDATLTGTGGPLDKLRDFYQGLDGVIGLKATATIGEGIVEISNPENPRFVEATNRVVSYGAVNGLSPLLAICVSWQTTLARRSGRGRTFLGPIRDTATDGATGTPVDSVLTTVRTAAQALINASQAGNGWGIGVYGKANPGQADPTKTLRDFTGMSVADRFAYLSSRRD